MDLIRSGTSLHCPRSMTSAIFHGEIRMSWEFLHGGYNLAVLALAQQAVEFRGANGLGSRYCEEEVHENRDMYRRTDQSPYDLLFYKHQVRDNRPMPDGAEKLWLEHVALDKRRVERAAERGTMKPSPHDPLHAWKVKREQFWGVEGARAEPEP